MKTNNYTIEELDWISRVCELSKYEIVYENSRLGNLFNIFRIMGYTETQVEKLFIKLNLISRKLIIEEE